MVIAQRFGEGHRVLVTGGAGFVPSHLVDALIGRGCTVVAVDNFITGAKDNLGHLADNPRFTLIEADITEGLPAHHPAIAERFDAIMHMASPASPTDFGTIPVEILRVGSIGTLNLLERATADGARFLMASTSEAYGDPLVHPQPESYWATSTRSASAASTTRPSASPRPRRWVTTAAGHGRGDRPHLQHVRSSHAPGRRPRDPDVHQPGAAR